MPIKKFTEKKCMAKSNKGPVRPKQQTSPQQKTTKRISNHRNTLEYQTANEDAFIASKATTTNDEAAGSASQEKQNIPTFSTSITLTVHKQLSVGDTKEPLSAYELFFRDTSSVIKNSTCSFRELSAIVASMWDRLDSLDKLIYEKKSDLAKWEYIKLMRDRQQQQNQQSIPSYAELKQQKPTKESPKAKDINKPDLLKMNKDHNQQHQKQDVIQTSTEVEQQEPKPKQSPKAKDIIPDVLKMNNEKLEQQKPKKNKTPKAKDIIPDVLKINEQPYQQQAAKADTPKLANDKIKETKVLHTSSTVPVENSSTDGNKAPICLRVDCANKAKRNPLWDDQYCSNECVVIHLREEFKNFFKMHY